MKTCTKCQLSKTKNEFYSDKRRKDGLRSWCIQCQKNDNKKRESNYNEYRKKYRLEHKEEYREKKRKYYQEKKELILTTNSKWRQTLNGRYVSYRNSAKQRNINWELTKEDFEKFWQKDCYYCGEKIETIGIDRKDSSIGYKIDNIISCCYGCNIGKLDYTYDEYINRIIKIYNNLKLWEHIEK